ncbi:fluoride efflux transporter CrcB [Amycolatopsis sp. WQ 127309]|uniref:fluoride efflux transporter CrcB n=1 Tax=Amycolatopsis sp. WQ 127309 TaxID=2932773 RepID=UPI001FF58031|nr:fluoride efflux transporter CrcB [Amycolatopsis sp. WQ 127309]UOZ03169.1 fluoride efflux transporter CrcB [Amycolatopsis sp. WQ 127309]
MPHSEPASPQRRRHLQTVAVVAAGGVLGACARYGATLLWPTASGGFPWTTFWINVTGCAAMGVLMAVITAMPAAHPLVRPFLGTGVLGGYTTFSTYAVDAEHLLDGGHAPTALLYLVATVIAAVAAVWATGALTRRALSLGSRS